jgi:diguanylate cyclase (GGDEF)-like protein/PAS domain S-box-containing protein
VVSVPRPQEGNHPATSVVGLAVAVFVLALAALDLRPAGSVAAPWWPAAGVAVAWLLHAPRSHHRALLVTVAVASGAANLAGGRPVALAAALGVVNALEVLVIGRCLTGSDRGRPHLSTVADVGRFLFAVLAGSVVLGVGVGTAVWGLGGSPVEAARTVVVAHAAAVLVIAPIVLVDHRSVSTRLRRAEAALQWAAALAVTVAVFAPRQHLPLTFLPMPLLVWGAVRSGPRTTVAQVGAVGVVAVVLTRLGCGPFAASGADLPPGRTAALVQLFLLVYGSVLLVLSVGIHQRGVAADLVADQEALYRGGFDQALLGMVLVRFDGTVLRVLQGNEVAARLLGTDSTALIDSAWCRSIRTGDRQELEAAVLDIVHGVASGWHGEVRMVIDGKERWIESAIAPIGDTSAGDVLSVQMIDVTERRIAHDQLTRLALHDPLTGLPNRLLLLDRLRHALQGAQRTRRPVAVLYLDLDGFKQVNDAAGHEQGDVVLRDTAGLLRAAVRDADTVARLGGDEFVVLSEEADAAGAEQVVNRVRSALHRTVVLDGRRYPLRVSVGVATSTGSSTAENLLHEADTAMYSDKRRRRAQHVGRSEPVGAAVT